MRWYKLMANDWKAVEYFLNTAAKFYGFENHIDMLNKIESGQASKEDAENVLRLAGLIQEEVHKAQIEALESVKNFSAGYLDGWRNIFKSK